VKKMLTAAHGRETIEHDEAWDTITRTKQQPPSTLLECSGFITGGGFFFAFEVRHGG